MKIVDYKVWPRFFRSIIEGDKRFELRETRGTQDPVVGTIVRLREWSRWTEKYTGREFLATVTYVLAGVQPGLPRDHIVFGFTAAPPLCNASAFSIEADMAAMSKAIESVRISVRKNGSPSETKIAAKEAAKIGITNSITGGSRVKPEHLEYMATDVALRAAIMVALDGRSGDAI